MKTRRIVILGFMGCGKTTVAQEVARRLDREFIDLDTFIAEREGRSPAEIISQDGEEAFRELESLALRDVLHDSGERVIALGGGTWTIPANRTLVALYDCLSVWLDAPFEVCWERIARADVHRPLAPDRETTQKRFDDRREHYASAERCIPLTQTDAVADVVEQILRQT